MKGPGDRDARPVLARLRIETRAEHDAIEAALDLRNVGLTRARYRHTLERLYGYYRPLEPRIVVICDRSVALGLDQRFKAALLEADLRALGEDAPDELPWCRDIPSIDSVAGALGCLYVREGATLGEMLGNEVHTACDGEAGVEAARALRPDAVLCDIEMPRMNGYDVARRIRAEGWGKNVVLVALTGWGREDDRRKTREVGFYGHLVKPVDVDVLTKLLASLSWKVERQLIAR